MSDKILNVENSIYNYAMENTMDLKKEKAFEYFGSNISYQTSKEDIEIMAKVFKNYGAKKGDVIAVISPLFPEVVDCFYGISKNGATFFPIDPRTNPSRIKDFLNLAEVRQAIMLDQAYLKIDQIIDNTKLEKVTVISAINSMNFVLGKMFKYDQIKKTKVYQKMREKINLMNEENINDELFAKRLIEEYETKEKYDTLTSADKKLVKDLKIYQDLKQVALKNAYNLLESHEGYIDLKVAKKEAKDIPSFEAVYDEKIPATLTLTSGTTGKPKVVPTFNRSFNVKVRDYYTDTTMPIETGDKMLSMPPFILYGEVFMHMAYCRGVQNVIIPDITAFPYGDVVLKKRINHLVGVPSQMLCFDDDKRLDTPPKFIKSVSVGGTEMKVQHERRINKHLEKNGLKITQGYSMSELTPASFTNMPGFTKEQSVGRPIGDTKALVVDVETGDILGPNKKGELLVNSETQFEGYYKNKEATEGMFTFYNDIKYVKTGDVAYYDEDGYYFILGRIKNMIIRPDGHNIFPREIEEIISTHKAVRDCAVVGVPYPNYEDPQGEYPRAHVVLYDEYKDKVDEIEYELKQLCSENLPERDVAYDYRFEDELPLTPVLKTDKIALWEKNKKESLSSKQLIKK